jgi:integrase
MPSNLVRTKYKNIYRDTSDRYYLRKQHNNKNIVRRLYSTTAYQASIEATELNLDTKQTHSTLRSIVNTYINTNYSTYSKNWKYQQELYFSKVESLMPFEIDTLTTENVQLVINKLYNTLSPKTVYEIRASLNAMYKWSINNGYATTNPITNTKYRKFDNTQNFTLSDQDIKNLIEAISSLDDTKYRLYFSLGLSGRRKGEIAYLKWKDIDFDNLIIHIR